MRTAETVCTLLREALAAQNDMSVDCRAAIEVDLSFVQLLLACRVSARQLGRTVTLATQPDGPLLDALTRTGFRAAHEDQAGQPPAYWFVPACPVEGAAT